MKTIIRTADPLKALVGYKNLKPLYEGSRSRVSRADRVKDGESVILKTIPVRGDLERAAARLQRESETLRRVRGNAVVRMLGLERPADIPVMVLEDVGGAGLDRLLAERRLSLREALYVGERIAAGLASLHATGIVHRNLNPANIVYNEQTGAVRIVGLGNTLVESRGPVPWAPFDALGYRVEYLSPEQTGRMNRSPDHRTDLYSLGAILYELLTGTCVFDADEPMEWLHCHIARIPVAPHAREASIPLPVSDLALRLLAKAPEDRYQSAEGVRVDLRMCLDRLTALGQLDAFELGIADRPARFEIPDRLYGRESDLTVLRQAFEASQRERLAIALVTGPSGAGKTRLIRELQPFVLESRGYFVVGKYDQMHRDVPYSGLISALSDLVRYVLAESDARVKYWRERMVDLVGANIRLMVDLLPDLALIVGERPPLPLLPPLESDQRFRLTLANFLDVFAHRDHPLVLVLDDVQWADAETLELTDLLFDMQDEQSLLLVATYRDTAGEEGHPIAGAVDMLHRRSTALFTIDLRPLTQEHLARLLADTLRVSEGEVEALAAQVASKTGGNPFFVDEFLKLLERERLIWLDATTGRWQWDLERIAAQRITDNVVDLMDVKLRRLPSATQRLLQLAACAGVRFSLAELAIMAEQGPHEVALGLHPALAEGLVVPLRGESASDLSASSHSDMEMASRLLFAFAHDRIQASAYRLLEESERERAHWRIGRLLLENLAPRARDERLFAIVNHLNIAAAGIDDRTQSLALCRLNRRAAKQARTSAAYGIAYGHLARALDLLGEDGWHDHYRLAHALHLEAAEAALLGGRYAELDELLRAGIRHSRGLLEKVPFHEIEISAAITRGELRKAVEVAKPILADLGHPYPQRPRAGHVLMELLGLTMRLRRYSNDDLLKLPPMTDEHHLAAIRIGGTLGSAAMFVQPMLLPLMIIRAAKVALRAGVAPWAGTTFCSLGMIMAMLLGKPERGRELGKVGLELSRQVADPRIQGRALHIYASLVQHWVEPLHATFEPLRRAASICLENGDFEYAVHATTLYHKHMFLAGVPLERVEREIADSRAPLQLLRQEALLHHQACARQTVHNLMGRNGNPARLSGESYDISTLLPQHRQAEDYTLVATVVSHDMYLRYLFGDIAGAVEAADEVEADPWSASGFQQGIWQAFIAALARSAAAAQAPRRRRIALMRKVRRTHRRFKRLARANPASFANKLNIIAGEWARVRGRPWVAQKYFDRAIEQAHAEGLIHEQALAAELCGAMHVEQRPTVGMAYLRDACALYRRWGAEAKATQLEQRFDISKSQVPARAAGSALNSLDVGALMKALKVIAHEQVHRKMVSAVITTAVEFAGAQRGVLVLRGARGEMHIEAEMTVDRGVPSAFQSRPLASDPGVAHPVINYVMRTGTGAVVHDARSISSDFAGLEHDPHVRRAAVRSILCLPIVAGAASGAELVGMLYLENNRTSHSFTDERFEVLEIICLAAAGRLELSRKASVDGLTDLYNHDYFQSTLKQEVANAVRHRRELSLMLIDIDHFKSFNDRWGHQLGDRILREVADLIRFNAREGDTVARYGGEEIAVILPRTGLDAAQRIAERLRAALASHAVQHEGQNLSVTVSVGLAVRGAITTDPQQLIQRADAALYRSKALGRNRVTVDH